MTDKNLPQFNPNLFSFEEPPENIVFEDVDYKDTSLMKREHNRVKRSPVMVEVADPEVTAVEITKLLETGMNIFKIRTAYTSFQQKIMLISRLEKASAQWAEKQGVPMYPVATSLSLRTTTTRCGIFKDEGTCKLQAGYEVILTNDATKMNVSTEKVIFVDHVNIALDVPIGMEITFGFTGVAVLICTEMINSNAIKCVVKKGGVVQSLQQVLFRGMKHTMPSISSVDLQLLKFVARYQIDIVIAMNVQNAEMVKKLQKVISDNNMSTILLSGISHQEGIDNFDEILEKSDGIVLFRDFLLFQLEYQNIFRIPLYQKAIAGKCLLAGKPLYLAGLLESSLVTGTLQTYEKADVTNALMDGMTGILINDARNLDHCVFSLQQLNEICLHIEPLTFGKSDFFRLLNEPSLPVNASEAAAMSCVMTANRCNARVVILSTVTGRTARILLRLHPACIIIAVCKRDKAARAIFTYRNCRPLKYTGLTNMEWNEVENARVEFAAQLAIANQWLIYGDLYIALQRSCDSHLFCDVIRIWTVTSRRKHTIECNYTPPESKEDLVVTDNKPKRKKKKKKVTTENEVQFEDDAEG